MTSVFEKYKKDLKNLVKQGESLLLSMQYHCEPKEFERQVKNAIKDEIEYKKFMEGLPNFKSNYQAWYSEAKVLLKQLLPDRLDDFARLYEKPKNRKAIQYGNYIIEDYLQSLTITDSWGEKRVGPSAAIPQFEQQLSILKAIEQRFESSLFDIRQLVQADIFDSELDAARELLKNKFSRAAGAMSGVVLERHLEQVAINHNIKITKKNPTINDLNDLLKEAEAIDTPQWRYNQHLADLRNLCDHNKKQEPTIENVQDLIMGVEKVTKTLF